MQSIRFRCLAITYVAAVLSSVAPVKSAMAQHEGHRPAEKPEQTTTPSDTSRHSHSDTGSMATMMMSALVPGIPHERAGSGTSWLPDHTAVRAWHRQYREWSLALHGSVSLRYTRQDAGEAGERGDEATDGPNWAMLMGQQPLGNSGLLTLRSMMSLDRVTEGGNGYPLLFQSGESWEGQPLVDRQHPHDFLMEVAAVYGRQTSPGSGYFIYFGLPGEPALGPPAFMHRPSAERMLDAPLGHHWQDATHITFGVLTGGAIIQSIKLDASVFTGREPDDNRWNIDKPKFDSYSGRISYSPSQRTTLQLSAGRLKSPEELEPDIDVTRLTASVSHHVPLQDERLWAWAMVWGMNDPSEGKTTQSILAETSCELPAVTPYGRLEWLQKSPEDLGLADGDSEQSFDIAALSLGVSMVTLSSHGLDLTSNIQASVYQVPGALEFTYGHRPWSVEVYLQLLPSRATHSMREHEAPSQSIEHRHR